MSDTAERDDPVQAWLLLPRRIYLDTSTLQALYDFDGPIFDGEPFGPSAGRHALQGLADEIDRAANMGSASSRRILSPQGWRCSAEPSEGTATLAP